MGYQNILSPKNHTRKTDKIHTNFELCQVFAHNFLCQKVWLFRLYILLTKIIDTFWSKGIEKFWFGGMETFWAKKSHIKNIDKILKAF